MAEKKKEIETYEVDVICSNCAIRTFLIEAKGKKRPESFICSNCSVESSTANMFTRKLEGEKENGN